MASTAETTTTYTCDLCKEETDYSELTRFYSEVYKFPHARHRVDVCPDCMGEPIGAVLELFAAQMERAK